MILQNHPEIIYEVSTTDNGNMSFFRGDPKEALKNRRKFLNKNKIDIAKIVTVGLVHGTKVIRVGKKDIGQGASPEATLAEADGMITNEPGVVLFLMTADCLPIAIFDPQKKAVGLFHAGRVGLYKGMTEQAIQSMVNNFGSNPKDLLVTIGPSIGPCCYTIIFSQKHKQHANFVDYSTNAEWKPFSKIEQNKITFNLWGYTKQKLHKLGIIPENIQNLKECTYCNSKYFSHRKYEDDSLKNDYRFATVLGIK